MEVRTNSVKFLDLVLSNVLRYGCNAYRVTTVVNDLDNEERKF